VLIASLAFWSAVALLLDNRWQWIVFWVSFPVSWIIALWTRRRRERRQEP
jgi:hypothetical protein